jgi:GTP pyrophosphokinase
MAEAVIVTRNKSEKDLILNSYKQLIKATLEFTTKEERKVIRRAFDFSLDAHKDARRKSGEPYILHPLAVARILVKEIGLNDVTSIVCALLHDVVEDTFAELQDIQREFGEDAAKIIDGLTKISGVFDPASSKQAENFRKMLLTMSDDIRVAIIKIADRLHNMRTLEHTKRETQLKIASETKSLYAPLAHRLGLYAVKGELEDLALQFTEPDVYKTIAAKLQETKAERDRYMQNFIKPIAAKMQSIGLDCTIKGRVKGVNSIYEKTKTQNIPFDEVYDLFAIRIIINSKPEEEKWDCWRAYSAITSTYRPHPERTRDWISIPRASGYESLHVTVMGPKGRWVEVQIRTQRMDIQAEKGLAAHWKYKDSKEKDKQSKGEQALEHWLGSIRDLLENKSLSALDVVSEFKTGLVSEEIYVFTPKGDLKILPQGATALDFAYEIHSKLGHSCIGAKVNQRVVPLSYKLQNGDQVEVLTSKKQRPSAEWLDFVVTRKAIGYVKDELKEQRKGIVTRGKEIFDWKIRHMGITENHPLVKELLAEFKIPSLQEFFYRLGTHSVDVRRIVEFLNARQQEIVAGKLETALTPQLDIDNPTQIFEALVQHKLGVPTDSLVIGGDMARAGYHLAECCHPIPGDSIVGIADPDKMGGAGITVHRTNCPVAIEQMSSYGQRIVKSKWNDHQAISFLAAFKIVGQDKIGMLNSIIRVVSLIQKINIRSFTIDSQDGMFEGVIKVYIGGKEEADRLIENLGKISGVFKVQRLEAS